MEQLISYVTNLWQMSLSAAPWLVLGLLIGGLIKALVPMSFLQRHLGGEGFTPILKAALLGAPLPLCSCGVIPAAMGLRESGASKPATVSFLVSTPETGVDSVAISYALLGPFMAIVRPIAAIVSAITAGIFVKQIVSTTDSQTVKDQAGSASSETTCCSSTTVPDQASEESSCCESKETDAIKEQHLIQKIMAGIRYAFTDLFSMLLFWLCIGLIFAAAVQTFVPATFLAEQGSGLGAMFVMVLIGIPMYVCAAASTPIAAGFMLAGVSPGAALVFLMAGPATNISTLGVIGKELGRKSLVAYLSGVVSVAILAGLATDYFVRKLNIDIQAQLHTGQHLVPHSIAIISLFLLIFCATCSLRSSTSFSEK